MSVIGKLLVKLGLDNSEYKRKLQESKGETEEFTSSSTSGLAKVKGAFKSLAIATVVLGTIKKSWDFISKAVEAGAAVEGVKRAFDNLNQPNLLDDLKEATAGTVDELKLMQLTVQAKHFKIPLDQLATYLRFATVRAQETGQSVDYLVNSIVLGIGRKSPMILDNLQISTTNLRDELAKTGDIAQALSNIIQKEMGDAAKVVVGLKEKTEQSEVAWRNMLVALGDSFSIIKNVKSWFLDLKKTIAETVTEASKIPNLNGWQKLYAIINPDYAKQKTREASIESSKAVNAVNEEFDRYWQAIVGNINYTDEAIDAAIKKLESADFKIDDIDSNAVYWWDESQAKKVLGSLKEEKAARDAIAKASQKELEYQQNSLDGIKESIDAKQKELGIATDPAVQKAIADEIIALERKKASIETTIGLNKEANKAAQDAAKNTLAYQDAENRKAQAILQSQSKVYGDSLIYMESMLSLRRKEEQFAKSQAEYRKIKAENDELEKQIKLKKQTFTEGSQSHIENLISEYESFIKNNDLPTSAVVIFSAEIKKLKALIEDMPQNKLFEKGSEADIDNQISKLQEYITNSKLSVEALAKINTQIKELEEQKQKLAQNQYEVGSQSDYDNQIAKLDEQMRSLDKNSEAWQRLYEVKQKLIDQSDTIDHALEKERTSLMQFNDILQNSAIAGLSALGEAMGSLMSGNIEDVAMILLTPIADMAIQLGELAIATGIAIEGIKAAFENLNPYVAVAAGIALVALGTAVKGAISNMGRNGVSSASYNTFTGGGYSSDGASKNVQFSAPSWEGGKDEITTRVSGSDLILVIDREKNRRRG